MSALISTTALKQRLNQPGIRVVDATYPADPARYMAARIDNATLFDIDTIADTTSPLPHMLPTPDVFASAIGAMGIDRDDMVVVYDQSGITMAAARAWWMFRVFGYNNVFVLNGGLPAWCEENHPLVSGPPAPISAKKSTPHFQPNLVKTAQQIKDNIGNPDTCIIDARPPTRFSGQMPEPRPAMRAGHIPGSINIPFPDLIDHETGLLIPNNPQVLAVISNAPANIVTSCGSGVTACLLALALYEAGRKDTAVYDGSWAEWGRESSNLPIANHP